MREFKRHTDELAGLETFDPGVFVGDEEASQEICNFVLTLALLWNDFKDATYALDLLGECKPSDPPGPTREWGAYGGIDLHLLRYQVTLVRELQTLVCRHRAVARGHYLEGLVRELPPEARDAWHSMVQVALGFAPTGPFGQCLLMVRNKLAYHYDPRGIQTGYRNHFLGGGREDDRAFISRGDDMRSTRFYFADAAAFGYVREVPGGDDWDRLSADIRGVLAELADALLGVVQGFVRRRTGGGGFEEETPSEERSEEREEQPVLSEGAPDDLIPERRG
jgi:hypothetical protein